MCYVHVYLTFEQIAFQDIGFVFDNVHKIH